MEIKALNSLYALLLKLGCDLLFSTLLLLFRCLMPRIRCLISFLWWGQTLAGRETVVNSEQISGRAAAQQISSQEANFSKQAELMRTLNTHIHTERESERQTHTHTHAYTHNSVSEHLEAPRPRGQSSPDTWWEQGHQSCRIREERAPQGGNANLLSASQLILLSTEYSCV